MLALPEALIEQHGFKKKKESKAESAIKPTEACPSLNLRCFIESAPFTGTISASRVRFRVRNPQCGSREQVHVHRSFCVNLSHFWNLFQCF